MMLPFEWNFDALNACIAIFSFSCSIKGHFKSFKGYLNLPLHLFYKSELANLTTHCISLFYLVQSSCCYKKKK